MEENGCVEDEVDDATLNVNHYNGDCFRRWKTTNYCKPHRGKTLLRASAFFAGFLSEGMSDD